MLLINIETWSDEIIEARAEEEHNSSGLYKLTFYCAQCKKRKPIYNTYYGVSVICEECSKQLRAESDKDFQKMRRQG